MRISIFLFDGVTALDAVGPYEALQRLPDSEIEFVGLSSGPKRTGNGFLALMADRPIADVHATDVLLVPGGSGDGFSSLLTNPELMAWLCRIDLTTTFTGSICSGALVLAAAGLLRGRRAATHWRAKAGLPRFDVRYAPERVVVDGKYVTSAGVSAGIDMGLILCDRLAGREVAEAIELGMQYDPQPPFGTGNAETASPDLVRRVSERLRG